MRKRKKLFNSRKSNIIINSAVFIIGLFVFVLISYFGYKLYSELSPMVKPELVHNESVEAFEEVEDRYSDVFTGLIVLALLGFWAFVIIAAMMSSQHPVLFIFSIILILFVIIVSLILGNTYEEIFSHEEYTGVTSAFLIPHFIFTHMLEISIGVLMSGILIAFMRSRYDD